MDGRGNPIQWTPMDYWAVWVKRENQNTPFIQVKKEELDTPHLQYPVTVVEFQYTSLDPNDFDERW